VKRKFVMALAVVLGLAGLSGCSTIAPPDQVGLYYMEGPSDGYRFSHCISPSSADDPEWNNSVVFLPTSLRTWNVAPGSKDSDQPIIKSSKPEDGQPSGVQVAVWVQINFYLNTYCDDSGGMAREFWEKLGRRYKADTDEGWRDLMNNTVVKALDKAVGDTTRLYGADVLVGNIDGAWEQARRNISDRFFTELGRLSGGDYFCGPTFDRTKPDCPEVEAFISDVDFADPGIQQARNDKQKALEEAAGKIARAEADAKAAKVTAQGQVAAADELAKLYGNKAWVALEQARIQLQIAQACGNNPNCHMILGVEDPDLLVTAN